MLFKNTFSRFLRFTCDVKRIIFKIIFLKKTFKQESKQSSSRCLQAQMICRISLCKSLGFENQRDIERNTLFFGSCGKKAELYLWQIGRLILIYCKFWAAIFSTPRYRVFQGFRLNRS